MKFLKFLGLIIVVLAVLFIGKGLLTPSVSYQCEVTVNKPIPEAWSVMSDPESLPKWIKGFQKSELITGKENTIGAVSKVYIEEGGQEMIMEETITAIKTNEHIAMSFTMDFMNMDYEMFFKDVNGKTVITTKSKTVGNGIFAKAMVSFMPDAMRKQEEENLGNLKNIIETNTKNYFQQPEAPLQ